MANKNETGPTAAEMLKQQEAERTERQEKEAADRRRQQQAANVGAAEETLRKEQATMKEAQEMDPDKPAVTEEDKLVQNSAAGRQALIQANEERYNASVAATATREIQTPETPQQLAQMTPQEEDKPKVVPDLARVVKTSYVNDVLVEVAAGEEGPLVSWPAGVDPANAGPNLVPCDKSGKPIKL